MTQKFADLQVPDIVEPQLVVEAYAAPCGADRDAGDDGDLVPTVAVTMHRRLASWRPGLGDVGNQEEAGFVGKDEVGTQPRSVFFTRGHSVRFQRAMAASSRSAA